jgi:hypothetical protein
VLPSMRRVFGERRLSLDPVGNESDLAARFSHRGALARSAAPQPLPGVEPTYRPIAMNSAAPSSTPRLIALHMLSCGRTPSGQPSVSCPAPPIPVAVSTKGTVALSRPAANHDRSGEPGKDRRRRLATAGVQRPCSGPAPRSRSPQEGPHD